MRQTVDTNGHDCLMLTPNCWIGLETVAQATAATVPTKTTQQILSNGAGCVALLCGSNNYGLNLGFGSSIDITGDVLLHGNLTMPVNPTDGSGGSITAGGMISGNCVMKFGY